MSGTKVQPFRPPSSPYMAVNPPPPPPFPSPPTLPLTSVQSSMSSSPTGEEKFLPWNLIIKLIGIAMPIIVMLIVLMLRKCNSSNGGHINGGSGRSQNQTSTELQIVVPVDTSDFV